MSKRLHLSGRVQLGLPRNGVQKRGWNSLILRLSAFAQVCAHLSACFGPLAESLKAAFARVYLMFLCVCESPFCYTSYGRSPLPGVLCINLTRGGLAT